jgi:hypothetical protein
VDASEWESPCKGGLWLQVQSSGTVDGGVVAATATQNNGISFTHTHLYYQLSRYARTGERCYQHESLVG